MTNFQSDALYNFLNLNNPATNAVESCTTKFDSIQSGNIAQFDILNEKLDALLSGNTQSSPSTSSQPIIPSVTGSITTGGNTLLTGRVLQLNTIN